ncbi:MAG: class I mannose-6-phosphate isomerase, partial [Flavobacterium sp.]|nr:class I mannose-6-phosphate isomerase [Flavobacterium sp.]
MKFYPLQFKAIFKDRIWGGTKLNSDLHKNATSNFTGESWEISTVGDNVSVILNGTMSGESLTDIIHKYPIEILGNSVHERFGFEFPLLFKYLDAKLDLSIQVHPNDDLARQRHSSFGKTEMWYVMQADVNAELIVGFKNDSSPQEYIKSVQNNNLLSILDCKKVYKG